MRHSRRRLLGRACLLGMAVRGAIVVLPNRHELVAGTVRKLVREHHYARLRALRHESPRLLQE